jgi:hypothetical protein
MRMTSRSYKLAWMKLHSATAMLRMTSTSDTMNIDAVVQNFRGSQEGRKGGGGEEGENDIVIEVEKYRVKTYLAAVKSL